MTLTNLFKTRYHLAAAVLACPYESYHDRMICEDITAVVRAVSEGRTIVQINMSATPREGLGWNYSPRYAAETLRSRAVRSWHRLEWL